MFQSPATYFPKPSEVRKRHHVPPALTGEFASHYVDRELRIVEMQERIEKMTNENQSMVETQTDLEQKYENVWRNFDKINDLEVRANIDLNFTYVILPLSI